MDEIIIKLPEELKFIKPVPSIGWSILVSKLIKSKLDEMLRLQKIVNKSQLSEKDVEELSDKVNASLSQRYL
jgi:hypothetical protein